MTNMICNYRLQQHFQKKVLILYVNFNLTIDTIYESKN